MAGSRAWIVAGSVGAVEALKDQGFARWNYALRSIHQHVKSNVGSISQANLLPFSPATEANNNTAKTRQSEESLRKVMYLSCCLLGS